ncbi:MAG: sigma-70 family RNA polymerase sigma factor [Ruminococcaceae bacterium]|nr:sigma-70 family RNA polymerase sigma factor [Oscillospiraceae bacterium]
MTIVKNHSAAEDVMQDTFVRLYGAAGRFRAGGMGKAWIMRIARNLALNAVTRGDYPSEEPTAERASNDSTEDSAISSVMLERAMQKLGDEERQIVTLHALSGMKLHEIAAALELPLGTVKWKHSRALSVLRKELEGEA